MLDKMAGEKRGKVLKGKEDEAFVIYLWLWKPL